MAHGLSSSIRMILDHDGDSDSGINLLMLTNWKNDLVFLSAGARYDTRPITLWPVVICNEGGVPKFGASAEFLGQESLFRPALNHLETHDSVGAAHWCDNGDSRLDLLPTEDRDKAIQELADTLKPIPFEGGTSASDEAGEQAFRKLIRLIIRDAYGRNPKPLPVIVFLHGDHTGQPRGELNNSSMIFWKRLVLCSA